MKQAHVKTDAILSDLAYDIAIELLDQGVMPFFIPKDGSLHYATHDVSMRTLPCFASPDPNVRLGYAVKGLLLAGRRIHGA